MFLDVYVLEIQITDIFKSSLAIMKSTLSTAEVSELEDTETKCENSFLTFILHYTESPNHCYNSREKSRHTIIKEVKWSLFTVGMIVYAGNCLIIYQKLLQLKSEFRKIIKCLL